MRSRSSLAPGNGGPAWDSVLLGSSAERGGGTMVKGRAAEGGRVCVCVSE